MITAQVPTWELIFESSEGRRFVSIHRGPLTMSVELKLKTDAQVLAGEAVRLVASSQVRVNQSTVYEVKKKLT